MFEKDQFVEYVGAASGSSYASGLSNIERLYGVDIDGEYEKDSCNELLSRLDELKRETGITQAELSNRQNRYSNLKKYIEFRNGGKVRIVDQYRQCFMFSDTRTVTRRLPSSELTVWWTWTYQKHLRFQSQMILMFRITSLKSFQCTTPVSAR